MSDTAYKCPGRTLLTAGLIAESDLERATQLHRATGQRITDALIEIGAVTEDQVQHALAREFGMECVDLADLRVDRALLDLVPHQVAVRHCVFPVAVEDNHLVLASADPLDTEADDLVAAASGKLVKPVLAPRSELRAIIQNYYESDEVILESACAVASEADMEVLGAPETGITLEELEAKAEQVPVVRIVGHIISDAYRRRASDIHIEPRENTVIVRYRLDGMLHTILHLPKRVQLAVASRIKVIADMDIANSRSPQDGRAKVRVGERGLDLRISTLPTIHGETVVIRLLDQGQEAYGLEELGLGGGALEAARAALAQPQGMILLTGPTGSGKTTTLYAALTQLRQDATNIVTVEDPIEYQITGISQVQVNPRAGVTFASGLRSILRQDPDVIMIGEMRDLETAEIALRSALTGHLVLSTLHTNDAPSTVARLVDVGLEPYLIASSLLLVIAQRLVRRICPDCKVPDVDAAARDDAQQGLVADGSVRFYRGAGCEKCEGTGYRGRIGVYEVMPVTEEIGQLISSHQPTAVIAQAARRAGMRTLIEDGMAKAVAGVTSLPEVLRVCGSDHDAGPTARPLTGHGFPAPRTATARTVAPSARPMVLMACKCGAFPGLKQALASHYVVNEVGPAEIFGAAERENPAAVVITGDRSTAPYVCRALRATASGSSAVLLVLGPPEDEAEVLEAGADVFAPLDALPQLIAARIRAALRHA